jgi:flavodoxin I
VEKAIIVYGSTMGNTEQLATKVEEILSDDYETTIENVNDVNVEVLKGFDLIVFGSSTWGAGELQDDFYDFYDNLDQVDLSAKRAAVFGPGDTAYGDMFCQAVDMLEEKLEQRGAELIQAGFKWDGEITAEAETSIKEWATAL